MRFFGLILEGVTGTGKSTLFRALEKSPVLAAAESRLALSQTYTLRVADPACRPALLESQVRLLSDLHRPFAASEFAGRADARGTFCYLLEGFHYYMALEFQPEETHEAFVRRFDAELAPLGALLVALTVPQEAVREVCVRSTLRHRGESWRRFLEQFGADEDEITGYFERRQERFAELRRESLLPVLEVDTSRQDWPRMVAEIEDFVRRHGWVS